MLSLTALASASSAGESSAPPSAADSPAPPPFTSNTLCQQLLLLPDWPRESAPARRPGRCSARRRRSIRRPPPARARAPCASRGWRRWERSRASPVAVARVLEVDRIVGERERETGRVVELGPAPELAQRPARALEAGAVGALREPLEARQPGIGAFEELALGGRDAPADGRRLEVLGPAEIDHQRRPRCSVGEKLEQHALGHRRLEAAADERGEEERRDNHGPAAGEAHGGLES